jgi:type VI secretion system secreted protein VgrG
MGPIKLTLCLGLLAAAVPGWGQVGVRRFNTNTAKLSIDQSSDLEQRIAELEILVEQQQEQLERLEAIIHFTNNGTEVQVDVLKAGNSNRLQVQAADLDLLVEGSMTVQVGGNHTQTVGSNQATQVGGNRSLSIDGNQTITVSGARSLSVDQDETIAIGTTRSLTVGSNQATQVGSNQTITVGGARSLSVDKDETIAIGTNRSLTVDKDETIAVGGTRLLDVGDYTETNVGDSEIIKRKDGFISIQGRDIQIKASDELILKGGKVISNK